MEMLLEPEDIRRTRKKLGLNQGDAGDVINFVPRAAQKYEAGDLLPSRAISSVLDRDPTALQELQARRHKVPALVGASPVWKYGYRSMGSGPANCPRGIDRN